MIGIGQFSDKVGIATHTLRRLEASGRLIPMHITSGGHRRYDESQIEGAAAFVKRLKLLSGGSNVISGDNEMTPFFAYLFGLILADGNVLKSGQMQLELKDEQLIRDVASELCVEYHPRKNRGTFRLTVPRPMAANLVEFGVCRRKSYGFHLPVMGKDNFGDCLRGLFDGDGSKRIRDGRITVRFHGHPKSMAYLQETFMDEFGFYMPWVADNRTESGMLETSRKAFVDFLRLVMYEREGIRLERKVF